MEKVCFFVCYTVGGVTRDRVVFIGNGLKGIELVNAIREAVHPSNVGDMSDGFKPQLSRDCVLINFFEI